MGLGLEGAEQSPARELCREEQQRPSREGEGSSAPPRRVLAEELGRGLRLRVGVGVGLGLRLGLGLGLGLGQGLGLGLEFGLEFGLGLGLRLGLGLAMRLGLGLGLDLGLGLGLGLGFGLRFGSGLGLGPAVLGCLAQSSSPRVPRAHAPAARHEGFLVPREPLELTDRRQQRLHIRSGYTTTAVKTQPRLNPLYPTSTTQLTDRQQQRLHYSSGYTIAAVTL